MPLFPRKKSNQFLKETQHGRTLTEMLGVIAVIGVLTIGSIAGYNFAMTKYRANETQNTLNIWALTCMQQLALTDTLDTSELGSVTSLGYAIAAAYPIEGRDNSFQITLGGGGVPVSVCKRLLEMDWQVPAEIRVGDQIFQGDSNICGESDAAPEMVYTFDETGNFNAGENPDDNDCPGGQTCGTTCCAANATCIDEMCCLSALVCDGVCCPMDKPACEGGVCVDPEDKPCTTNADCANNGAGYFCQIGAKAECGSGTVVGKCKKVQATTFYGNGVRFAKSVGGSYTRFDLDNFCQALGMRPLTEAQADCVANPTCYALGLYENDSAFGAWNGFWVIMPNETDCTGDIMFFSTRQSRGISLNADPATKNRAEYLVCAKGTPSDACDDGYIYDAQSKKCVCNDDNACFSQTPNKPYCLDKQCVECRSNDQCVNTPDTPYCSEKTRTCVACRTSQDCAWTPETPVCNEQQEQCVKCGSDDDCKNVDGKPYCNGAGKCVACYNNDHCDTDSFCRVKDKVENCRQEDADGTCETLKYKAYTDTQGGTWYKSDGGDQAYTWFDTQNYCDALKRKLGGSIRTITRADLGCASAVPTQQCPATLIKNLGWAGDHYLEAASGCTAYEWINAYGNEPHLRPVQKTGSRDYGTLSYASCYKP